MRKTRRILFAAAILVLLLIPVSAFATFSGTKICIDPGHGGSDPGAGGYGLYESSTNLDISLRAQNLFQLDGATVIMTRTSDVDVSLQGRCDIANNAGADRFECSHCNAYDGSAYGTETYCWASGSSTSFDLRDKIHPQMVSQMGTYDRGTKTANYYVLINTSMPAILAEVAFIDNASDNAKLASSSYRQAAAKAYLYGTQVHYGMTAHDPVTEVIVDNGSAGFSASSNWSTGSSSTDKYGSDYRYRSTQATSDAATFTPSLTYSGNYAVYAWWPAGSNRSSSAPYIIHYNGGTQTVTVNQQSNGGQWNYLGTWSFTNGNNVQLSCWAPTGYNVIADAVKFVSQ